MESETPQEMIGVDEAAVLVAEARREVTQSAQAIAELCLIAGCPDKAAEWIAAGMTEAEVRQRLVAMKAAGQSPEIRSTIDLDKAAAVESTTSTNNPLIAAVKHLIGKE